MRKKPQVGRSESEVLRFIAERGSASVTEVGEHLAATKGQARNTALTMMERLRKKGFLTRKKSDGIFQYSPFTGKDALLTSFVEDFVDGVLGGAITPLVTYLGSRTEVDAGQLQELLRLARSLDESRGEESSNDVD
ncbi:MAG TPA: BlaI/MecI/CopY family transcriptional regulator [Fimbriimonas sp.]|nr:BlaI/MecI/CopY family transcriptional regulator [Fimbriimonas sp.]